MPKLDIYTDGSAEPNPGHGGWGAVMIWRGNIRIVGGYGGDWTTNNRMEMMGAIGALEICKTPSTIKVYSDSQLLINCASRKWGTHSNEDLWARMWPLLRRHEVTWEWVKGHSGHKYNEMADREATRQRKRGEMMGRATTAADRVFGTAHAG